MGMFKNLFSKKEKEEKVENEILIESWSPVCNIQAFVERSQNTVYFYLWVNPCSDHSGIKSCWVCNTVHASENMDYEALDNGNAPMMPLKYCNHDREGIDIDEQKLSIVWFEEGDAAALLENDRLLAVIPSWWGSEFHGYSRYAIGRAPFAWELSSAEDNLYKRVMKSKEYWAYLSGDYFKELQHMHLSALQDFFGTQDKYYAIDNNEFPPKALITGKNNDVNYAFTAGVSALCQPQVELSFGDDANQYRRIELGFACNEEFKNKKEYMDFLSYISGQTNLPWQEISWIGNGHTIPCNVISGFESVMFINHNIFSGIKSPKYDNFMGEAINLLWMIPITKEEYDFIVENSMDKLLEKYKGELEDIIVFDEKSKFL